MTPGVPPNVLTISLFSFHFGSFTLSVGSQWHSVFSPNLSPLHGTSIRRPARLVAGEPPVAGAVAGAATTLPAERAGGWVVAQPPTSQANPRARAVRLADGVEPVPELDVPVTMGSPAGAR